MGKNKRTKGKKKRTMGEKRRTMVEKIRRMGRKRRTKSRVEMTVEGEGRREDNKKKEGGEGKQGEKDEQ